MRSILLAFALLPTPALAGFDCTILRQCGGGTCEPFTGGNMLVEETGDVWSITMDGQRWEGYSASTLTEGGEVAVVVPPQNGMSGLISVYPSGEILFSVHANGSGAIAITGSGNCSGVGG
jgi:hypothetical protein